MKKEGREKISEVGNEMFEDAVDDGFILDIDAVALIVYTGSKDRFDG